MNLYDALIKKNKKGKIEDVVLLKEGFSFFAFLFGPLWFLYHKMWSEFLALLIVNFVLEAFSSKIFSDFDKNFLEVALLFIVALNANHWLCQNLKKKRYEFIGLVFGADCASAKLRFVKNFEADLTAQAVEFDDSILNPKLYQKMMKLKKAVFAE